MLPAYSVPPPGLPSGLSQEPFPATGLPISRFPHSNLLQPRIVTFVHHLAATEPPLVIFSNPSFFSSPTLALLHFNTLLTYYSLYSHYCTDYIHPPIILIALLPLQSPVFLLHETRDSTLPAGTIIRVAPPWQFSMVARLR